MSDPTKFLINSMITYGNHLKTVTKDPTEENLTTIHAEITNLTRELRKLLQNDQHPLFPEKIILKILEKIEPSLQQLKELDPKRCSDYEVLLKETKECKSQNKHALETGSSSSAAGVSQQGASPESGDSTQVEGSASDGPGQQQEEFTSLGNLEKKCLFCFCLFPPGKAVKKREPIHVWIGMGLVADSFKGGVILDRLVGGGFIECTTGNHKMFKRYLIKEQVRSMVVKEMNIDFNKDNTLSIMYQIQKQKQPHQQDQPTAAQQQQPQQEQPTAVQQQQPQHEQPTTSSLQQQPQQEQLTAVQQQQPQQEQLTAVQQQQPQQEQPTTSSLQQQPQQEQPTSSSLLQQPQKEQPIKSQQQQQQQSLSQVSQQQQHPSTSQDQQQQLEQSTSSQKQQQKQEQLSRPPQKQQQEPQSLSQQTASKKTLRKRMSGLQRSITFDQDDTNQDDTNQDDVNVSGSLVVNINENTTLQSKNFESIFKQKNNVKVLHLGNWFHDIKSHIVVEAESLKTLARQIGQVAFLSLQGVSGIVELPDSVYKLVNLKVLDLRGCPNLEFLPDGVQSLTKLTHLDLSECYLLDHIPKGIVSLTELRVLKGFIINHEASKMGNGNKKNKRNTSSDASFSHLKDLRKLIKLTIRTRRGDFPTADDLVTLCAMKELANLKITWVCNYKNDVSGVSESGRFPGSLKKLELEATPVNTLPRLLKLISDDKQNSLQKLYIRGGRFWHLGLENYCLPHIHTVRLRYLHELQVDWVQLKEFYPNFSRVEVFDCPNLFFFPCDENGVWNLDID